MQLTISTKDPDMLEHQCLALNCFVDEKPPRGVCGFIDWRLDGMISAEIKKGHISGHWEERTVIPFPRKVRSEMLLLFGLGHSREINYDKIYNSAFTIAEVTDKIGLDDFAFELFGKGRSGLETPHIVEAMVTGIFDFVAADIRKLEKKKSCIIASSADLEKITLGIRQFKAHVNDRGAVDFWDGESGF